MNIKATQKSALYLTGFLKKKGLVMKTNFVLPGEIEKRSFEIIRAELKERKIVDLDNKLAPVDMPRHPYDSRF